MDFTKERKKIEEIVSKKLNKKIEEIKYIDFVETLNEDCSIGVTAWVYIDKDVYFFTADADLNIPYYAVANNNIQAINQFVKDAENLQMYSEKRKHSFMAANFNRKQIVACLIDYYTQQLEPAIEICAKITANKMIEDNISLQISYYDTITADVRLDNNETIKLDDSHYLVRGKIDRAKFNECAKLQSQLMEMKADVAS